MLMYMFTPDKDGDMVRDALTEAARRGVEVKLLVDGFGSAATPNSSPSSPRPAASIASSTRAGGGAISFATTRS